MCTLVLYFQVFTGYPIVIAANRDEVLTRPSHPPELLNFSPAIFGGKDLIAGGTWFGINESGVVAGMLNRREPRPNDPRLPSRGTLCVDSLKKISATPAAEWVTRQPAAAYNPFNLLVCDPQEAYFIWPEAEGTIAKPVDPGVHLLTNMNPNDDTCPKIQRASPHFRSIAERSVSKTSGTSALSTSVSISSLFAQLAKQMSHHSSRPKTTTAETGGSDLCIHLAGYGTRSSTLLAYSAKESRFIYHFADGPPCKTPYVEMTLPSPPFANQPPSTT